MNDVSSQIADGRLSSPRVDVSAAVTLWDGVRDQVRGEGLVVLWEGAAPHADILSLAEYLNDHRDEIRGKYLAWAHDLSLTSVLGRRLCERFSIGDRESLWPRSLFVEQSIWNQRSLEKILKLLAFERLLLERGCQQVEFSGSDADLSRILRALCRQRKISYVWRRVPSGRRAARSLRRALPEVVRGIAALGYYFLNRLKLPRPRVVDSGAGPRALICAPFFNHNADGNCAKQFSSRYWTALPRVLLESGWQVQWLHLYYRHEAIPDAHEARRVLERVQLESPSSGNHSFVETYMPLSAFARVLLRWCCLVVESVLVGTSLRLRFARNPHESFWPLLRHDWASAFRGIDCVSALVYSESFNAALSVLPRQDEGIYLMENQGWERSLARAWRVHGHGRLGGVAHSTIRFWDLRYHCDPRRYEPEWRKLLPSPSVVILNGPAARKEYLATSGVREELADCEALRYLHLRRGSARAFDRQGTLVLLVLGDFLRELTDGLLRLVDGAQRNSRVPLEIWIKPHPNCPVDDRSGGGLALRVVQEPVPQLVSAVHVVLASNMTSAAVDAYIGGGRMLVHDDCRGVNFSPLQGVPGVRFVHDARELALAIEELSTDAADRARGQQQEFFHIDASLPLWREHFGLPRPCESESSDR